jgi:hypothetical protein
MKINTTAPAHYPHCNVPHLRILSSVAKQLGEHSMGFPNVWVQVNSLAVQLCVSVAGRQQAKQTFYSYSIIQHSTQSNCITNQFVGKGAILTASCLCSGNAFSPCTAAQYASRAWHRSVIERLGSKLIWHLADAVQATNVASVWVFVFLLVSHPPS